MHLPHFSKDLMSIHVWRQTQTQSTINSFYEEDMNIFHPRRNDRSETDGLFRMEFPIMQWLVAAQYKLFGQHLIITRLFMFFIGLLTVFGMFKLLETLFHNTTLALIGSWAFNFSPSFYYYTINPLPDNFALCCGVWGITCFFIWYEKKKTLYLLLCSILLCVGTLTKLPYVIYYFVPFVYFLGVLFRQGFSKPLFLQAFIFLSLLIFPIYWYTTVIPSWSGNAVIAGMMENEQSFLKLLDYFQSNLISTLPELLVGYGAFLFFLLGFYYLWKNKAFRHPKFKLLLSLSLITLLYYLFEANAIGSVHDYYLFPFFPLLFILVAYGAFHLYNSGSPFKRALTYLLIVLIPFTCFLRMQTRWNPDEPGFNKDLLTYKNELRNAVPKNDLVIAGNDESHFIMLYYIDKKGWGFNEDQLTPEGLQSMIDKGARYLYSDSEKINTSEALKPYFTEVVLEKGSIKVYKLNRAIQKNPE
jgi:4-amino-4-deoxy-L-arabinose transferase-like glycosyltransferase